MLMFYKKKHKQLIQNGSSYKNKRRYIQPQKRGAGEIQKRNFHLTINTGQSYKNDDPHLENDSHIFDTTISEILHHIEDYVCIPEGHTWDDSTIKDVDISYVIE
jgi:hypothetical protein